MCLSPPLDPQSHEISHALKACAHLHLHLQVDVKVNEFQQARNTRSSTHTAHDIDNQGRQAVILNMELAALYHNPFGGKKGWPSASVPFSVVGPFSEVVGMIRVVGAR